MKKIFATLFPILFFAGIAQFFFLGLNKKSWYILIPILATVVMILLFRKAYDNSLREKENDVLGEVDGLAMYMALLSVIVLKCSTLHRKHLKYSNACSLTPFALDTADTWANRFDSYSPRKATITLKWYTGTDYLRPFTLAEQWLNMGFPPLLHP